VSNSILLAPWLNAKKLFIFMLTNRYDAEKFKERQIEKAIPATKMNDEKKERLEELEH